MKFVVGETGRNPEKNLPRQRFVTTKSTQNDRDENSGSQRPVGDERLTNCLHQRGIIRLIEKLPNSKSTYSKTVLLSVGDLKILDRQACVVLGPIATVID